MRLGKFSRTTLGVVALPISHVCPECGTMKNSGKRSCCGRGGAWFGKCGGAGDANLGHSWYEGIQACKARQFKVAVVHQVHASKPNNDDASPDPASMVARSKEVIATAHELTSTAVSTSKPMTVSSPITVSTNISMISPDHTFVMYDAGTTTSRATTAINTAMGHTSVRILKLKSTIPSFNERVTRSDDSRSVKSISSASADMSMGTTSGPSASAAIVLHLLVYTTMVPMISCRY